MLNLNGVDVVCLTTCHENEVRDNAVPVVYRGRLVFEIVSRENGPAEVEVHLIELMQQSIDS